MTFHCITQTGFGPGMNPYFGSEKRAAVGELKIYAFATTDFCTRANMQSSH
jgi:hypothetical protein